MDDQLDARLVGHRADFFQEIDQVAAKFLGINVFVAVQLMLELIQRETFLRAGKTGDHVAHEHLLVLIGHLRKTRLCLFDLGRRVFFLGTGPLQQEEVEGNKGRPLEPKGRTAVRAAVFQVRARPVQYRHEVIGNHVDAARAEVAQALFVVVDVALEVAFLRFDMFVDGHAFHTAPAKAGGFHLIFAFHDFLNRPYFPVGNMVKGGDDARASGLADIHQTDRVLGPVPAEGLFKIIHILLNELFFQ